MKNKQVWNAWCQVHDAGGLDISTLKIRTLREDPKQQEEFDSLVESHFKRGTRWLRVFIDPQIVSVAQSE